MSFKKIAMTLALILSTVAAVAQTKTVKGVIYEEETGEPMPGATVSVEGSTRGVMTDLDGSFELTGVKPTDKLKFECLGKETQVLQVGTMTNFVVKLKNAANELDEVTVVAFGKQRKESVIGSISTVDVKTLKVPSSNLTTALAGNVAGVIAYQRTGEPGQDNADFFVRGITTFGANTSPLILIDNIELTSTDLARLQPDDIESFSIMKDATATALYGARGANGVIFVTTKRGQEGPAKIFARVETSISAPTDVVELADPVTYMKSYNEAISTRDPLGELMYTYDKIEQTGKPGANRLIYPANDWYDMLFKDFATSYRANVSARGGGKVATYYVSGAYTEDTGVLKVDKRNSFNNNIDDKNYTLRSNVDINVTPTTKLAVRLTGNFRDYQGPLNGGSDVYRQVMHSDPVLFPAYYPVDDEHVGIQHIMFGNYEDGSYINPYANLVKGYKNYQRSQMIAAVQLEQDLKFITKGLSFMTLFNLTRLSEFTVNRQFNPYWYRLDRYDSYTGEYHVNRINENGTDYLTYSESGKTVKNTMYSETRLNYNRSFGKHDVTGVIVSSNEVIPYYAEGFGVAMEKVIPLGSPRCDVLENESYKKRFVKNFYKDNPELKGKRILLFAPTFRGGGMGNCSYPIEKFEADKIFDSIEEDWVIAVKMHPYLQERPNCSDKYKSRLIDFTSEYDINDLLFVTDLLVTDYSSVIFEASIVDVPMLFYAFDLNEYSRDRDFYCNFSTFVPGKIVLNTEEMIDSINCNDYKKELVKPFRQRYFGEKTGRATKNVVEFTKELLEKNV